MAALAADRHGVAAAAGECLSQALFRVEGFAALIENYRGEIGAEPKCNRRGSAPGTVRFEMSAYQLAIGGKADPIRLNEVFNPRQLALPASSSSGLKVSGVGFGLGLFLSYSLAPRQPAKPRPLSEDR
jgi:hypothetical protein